MFGIVRRWMCTHGKGTRDKFPESKPQGTNNSAYISLQDAPPEHIYFEKDDCRTKATKLFSSCRVEDVCDSASIAQFLNARNTVASRREIVIFGRSNVGKSSLINKLFFGLEAAFVSKKPGKTQNLHFYRLNDNNKQLYLVDSPGYGFANHASKKQMDSWKYMINTYLKSDYLHRAICLFDSEHGLKPTDRMLMRLLDSVKKPYMVVATKCDKKPVERSQLQNLLDEHALMNSFVHLTSCRSNTGIHQLRSHLTYLLEQPLSNIPTS